MKKTHENSRDTRDRILDAATGEFAGHGLAGARVDRVAQRAGVNKAMIYYHFSSKENLYESIIDRQFERVADLLDVAVDSDADLEEILRQVSETYHDIFEAESPFRAILMYELATGAERLKRSLKRQVFERGLPEKVQKMITAGIRRGRLRKIDSRQALISFAGMNLFYLMMAPIAATIWEIDDEKKFRDKRPAHIVDLFLHGITKK
jgi:AcrR family transcriptional regulator